MDLRDGRGEKREKERLNGREGRNETKYQCKGYEQSADRMREMRKIRKGDEKWARVSSCLCSVIFFLLQEEEETYRQGARASLDAFAGGFYRE